MKSHLMLDIINKVLRRFRFLALLMFSLNSDKNETLGKPMTAGKAPAIFKL